MSAPVGVCSRGEGCLVQGGAWPRGIWSQWVSFPEGGVSAQEGGDPPVCCIIGQQTNVDWNALVSLVSNETNTDVRMYT